jgi:hypothetical protein
MVWQLLFQRKMLNLPFRGAQLSGWNRKVGLLLACLHALFRSLNNTSSQHVRVWQHGTNTSLVLLNEFCTDQ